MWMHLDIHAGGLINRRAFLGASALSMAGWKGEVVAQAQTLRKQGLSCILLFMTGGPSQLETFDPKPGTPTGGPTKSIATALPGIQIAEGWENTARVMKEISIIRSMTNNVAEHTRAQYQLHTGYLPSGGVKYPTFGSTVAGELPSPMDDLPSFVSIGTPGNTIGSGFLGMSQAPFVVNDASKLPANVSKANRLDEQRFAGRLSLLEDLEGQYAKKGAKARVEDHKAIYANAARLVRSPNLKTFDIASESNEMQEKYGKTPFGRGCLLARRLVESGVPFVEVESRDWDTHFDHFERIKPLNSATDRGFAALVEDLAQRGMLEKTLVILMGEFGRTPIINPRTGRDHFPRAFSIAIAGAGIKKGFVLGSTNAGGTEVRERPVSVPDLFCTLCKALEINPRKENAGPLNRPIKIVDGGKPVDELFA
jgi:uncharacterized protein (DUF1501 family)